MFFRSNPSRAIFLALLTFLGLPSVLLVISRASAAPAPHPAVVIQIIPDQMSLNGHVATRANTVGQCTEPWLSATPAGSIILGVNPASCYPADWEGGSATAEVFLPAPASPTLYAIKLSWPDQDGKGLHSPDKDQTGMILLDGKPLWEMRTTLQSTFNDFYAAQHEPIQTTIVVTQPGTHTLEFRVPARTAWDLSQIEITEHSFPSTIRGVGYSPYRDCQMPGGTSMPTLQDIQDDLFRLSHTTTAIRTYAAGGVNHQIPSLANTAGLKVYAGAWLDQPKTTQAQDSAEIQALIDLAKSEHLEAAIVGNEYYLRHRSPDNLDYLKDRILEVKGAISGQGIAVTTAEIDDLMFDFSGPELRIKPEYRPILDAVDLVMVHIYPFWGGMPVDGAAAYVVARYQAIRTLLEREYPGQNKRVIIGEAGWPSGGKPNGAAVTTPENQRKYLIEFLKLAEQEGVEYLYFDAFDELWKIEEPGGVGQHWGYAYTDRTAKYSFFGLLLPTGLLPDAELAGLKKLFLPMVVGGKQSQTFPVLSEWPAGPDHFVPSGWMGDIENTGMYECDRSGPHSGEMAVRASFSPTGTLGWSGVYWQYPENNWGNLPGGLDLSWANKLTFWAKGEQGGERIRFFAGGIGTKKDPYPDSLRPQASTGFIRLTNGWQQYSLHLGGRDLSHLIGGFGWAADRCADPDGAVFYLDDAYFEYDPNLPPLPPHGPTVPVYTDAAAPENSFIPSGWMGDAGVPGRVSLTECWTDKPHAGQTSIRIEYSQQVMGWTGIYWLNPAENWGDRPGGLDLAGADRLTFWVRSDTPGARVKLLIGGAGYPVDSSGNAYCSNPSEPFPDSVCPKIERWEQIPNQWTKFTIDLNAYPRDLSHVVAGFGLVAEDEVILYLDDIVYEFDE